MAANSIVLIVVAYLLGSLPTGYLIGRLRGVDIRAQGDHYTGATNVSRALGRTAGIATAVIDIAKGAVVLLLARLFPVYPLATVAAGVAVVAGHIWPVFLRFKGGAGLATTIGVMLAALPREFGILMIPYLAVALPLHRRIGFGLSALPFLVPLLLLCWLFHEPWQYVALPPVIGALIGFRMYWRQIGGFLGGAFGKRG